jgi:hypothetical protein
MEQTECSETSAYKIQTPGNYPEENIQHTEHGDSLKSRIYKLISTGHAMQWAVPEPLLPLLPFALNCNIGEHNHFN